MRDAYSRLAAIITAWRFRLRHVLHGSTPGRRRLATQVVRRVAMRSPLLPAMLVFLLMLLCGAAWAGQKQPVSRPLFGKVTDALGRPIADATVTLQTYGGLTVAHAITDAQGVFRLPESKDGAYSLMTRKKGFKAAARVIVLPESAGKPLDLVLESQKALTVPVRASRIRAQNGLSETGTNKYTLTARDIANLPEGEATPLNEVLLQMPGVALDQNQEIHIRGEHMGIQYEMNGILLPLDINNEPTFTQLLNSYFIKSVSLIDGIVPAQYGYRTSGVIQIQTKDGCDGGHNNLMIYGGMYDTVQPSFELQGCHGKFSYYLTGLYLHSSLGFSSATPGHEPIHDTTDQGQGFAYLTYAPGPSTKLSLISGMTLAASEFPDRPGLPPLYKLSGVNPATYPSTAIDSGLDQQDYYGVMALNGVIGPNADYQIAYAAHYNTQTFNPDPVGDLIYQGISTRAFNSDFSNTIQGDVTYRLGDAHTFRDGFYFGEYGVESDNSSLVFRLGQNGNQIPPYVPIRVRTNLNKINLLYGAYVQDAWHLTEKLTANFGTRWDRVDGFALGSQFSPTLNLVYKARPDTTLHTGFARNFQVPNFQNISAGTNQLFKDTSGGVGVPVNTTI